MNLRQRQKPTGRGRQRKRRSRRRQHLESEQQWHSPSHPPPAPPRRAGGGTPWSPGGALASSDSAPNPTGTGFSTCHNATGPLGGGSRTAQPTNRGASSGGDWLNRPSSPILSRPRAHSPGAAVLRGYDFVVSWKMRFRAPVWSARKGARRLHSVYGAQPVPGRSQEMLNNGTAASVKISLKETDTEPTRQEFAGLPRSPLLTRFARSAYHVTECAGALH